MSVFYINRIPCIETTGVNVTADNVIFSFNPHPFVNRFFQGPIFVKVNNAFTAPETAVPIQFTTTNVPNSTITLTGKNNVEITTDDWEGTGIYMVFYDRVTNTLELIN